MAQPARPPTASDALRLAPPVLLVGGSWRQAGDGATFPVLDPATGEELVGVADGSVADGDSALAAAAEAAQAWAECPPRERAELLRRCFEAVRAHAEAP